MTSTAPAPAKLTAAQLDAAVRARYAPPEWFVESEVTLGGRRLDMVAFNLWGTRNYRVVGFEIKVDRGDWLRELAAVQKTEAWLEVVDTFYLVTAPKVIQPGELPLGWGHLELVGHRMMTRAAPPTSPARPTLPREVIARFLGREARRAEADVQQIEWRLRGELRDEIATRLKERHTQDREEDRQALAQVKRDLLELHQALGISGGYEKHRIAMRAAGLLAKYQWDGQGLGQQLQRLTDIVGDNHQALLKAVATMGGDPA